MSHNILKQAQASNLFDLTGVVAVVTGGGSVRHISTSLRSLENDALSRALD